MKFSPFSLPFYPIITLASPPRKGNKTLDFKAARAYNPHRCEALSRGKRRTGMGV